ASTARRSALRLASTPSTLLASLNADLRAVLADAAIRERFFQLGATPVGSNLADSKNFLTAETQKWSAVVQAANIRLD
ncbi:MAG: hypothetical protein EBY30_10045, partial [Rhodospirillales bacterium]|nr:hypothetical protein [Rhodospirillales bacterium]